MDHFHYQNGLLHAEEVPLDTLAREVGTPCYVYAQATMTRHVKVMQKAFTKTQPWLCYAVKANSNQSVLRVLAELDCGADTVSEGEIRRALKAGIAPDRIIFSGVGKTREEMAFALKAGIAQCNVESVEELHELNEVAGEKGCVAPIALRVNPQVDAKTHEKITTGRAQDKFGIAWEQAEAAFATAASLPHLRVVGLATHIGSQLTQMEPFAKAFRRLAELATRLRAQGHAIERMDVGGGLGIIYGEEAPPLPDAYAKTLEEIFQPLGCQLILEPGRVLMGNAGVLLTRVIRRKQTEAGTFLIVDAAMNDLMRPSLYDARHAIVPVQEPAASEEMQEVEVVGPVCETGDRFGRHYRLPKSLGPGNLVAIRSCGAYGAVMSHSYNSRLLVPEVLVHGSQHAVVRARPSYDALLDQDSMASWL